ncbi:MAG: hypothetical protein B7X58_03510, partial [Marinobacter sp. 34-60-7]
SQNSAEPWMAEPKRPMDGPKERVLDNPPPDVPTPILKRKRKMLESFVNFRHFIVLSRKIGQLRYVLILRS